MQTRLQELEEWEKAEDYSRKQAVKDAARERKDDAAARKKAEEEMRVREQEWDKAEEEAAAKREADETAWRLRQDMKWSEVKKWETASVDEMHKIAEENAKTQAEEEAKNMAAEEVAAKKVVPCNRLPLRKFVGESHSVMKTELTHSTPCKQAASESEWKHEQESRVKELQEWEHAAEIASRNMAVEEAQRHVADLAKNKAAAEEAAMKVRVLLEKFSPFVCVCGGFNCQV